MTVVAKHYDFLTWKDVTALLETPEGPHVSIYMPAHRDWPATDQDLLRFENLLENAVERLVEDAGLRMTDGRELLGPALALRADDPVWENQSDGLAVFVSDVDFSTHRLPLSFHQRVYVGKQFYLPPLTRWLADDTRYAALALGLDSARLYGGSRNSFREIGLAESITREMKDVDGFDPSDAVERGVVDGLYERVFRRIDEFIKDMLAGDEIPLLLIGREHERSVYAGQSTYSSLVGDGIEGLPEIWAESELQARSWSAVFPYVEAQRQLDVDRYLGLADAQPERTVHSIGAVLQAARAGQVDTLFIPRRSCTSDPEKGEAMRHAEPSETSEDLFDVAVFYTLLRDGTVRSFSEMPEALDAQVAALLRY